MYEKIQNGEPVEAETIAENAWGSALDNGSDILGVEPVPHAEEEYEGYIEHTLIVYEEVMKENGREVTEDRLNTLEAGAKKIIENRKL